VDDKFLALVLVANENTDALVALGVRILELWEECKTGKIERKTFQSVMMNLTEWFKTKGDIPMSDACMPFPLSN
jgi:hypothetical protein